MKKRRYKKQYWSYRKEIELEIANFLCFHDYYKNVEGKEKNDGCLEGMIKKIVKIVKHPERYTFIKTRPYQIGDFD